MHPISLKFAQSLVRLHLHTNQAKRFADEVMGATLSLKNSLCPGEDNRVNIDSVVQDLQTALVRLLGGKGLQLGAELTMLWL